MYQQFSRGEIFFTIEDLASILIDLGLIDEKIKFLLSSGIELCRRSENMIVDEVTNKGVKFHAKEPSKLSPLYLLINNLKEFLFFLSDHLRIRFFKINILDHVNLVELLKKKIEDSIIELEDPSAAHQDIYNILREFEISIFQKGLINETFNDLSKIAQNWKEITQKSNQTQVLARIRDLILSEDIRLIQVRDKTERGTISSMRLTSDKKKNESRFFKLRKMHITEQTKKIIEIVYKILDESLLRPENELLRSLRLVRDCFLMYKSLKYYSISSRATQPQIGSLFYNNCSYLIFHLILIPAHYSNHVPPHMQHAIYLADLIPIFQAQANQVYMQMKEFHKEKSLRFIRQIQFNNIEENYSSLEKLLNGTILSVLEGTSV